MSRQRCAYTFTRALKTTRQTFSTFPVPLKFPLLTLIVTGLTIWLWTTATASPARAPSLIAAGHNPTESIGYIDGSYTAPPTMRQGLASLNSARSTITDADDTDLYVNFREATTGWAVFVVYTTDGTAPTTTNGTCLTASLSRDDGTDRTWVARIPVSANVGGTAVNYRFYVNTAGGTCDNGGLTGADRRVASTAGGVENSWSEGDGVYYTYNVHYCSTQDGGWDTGATWTAGTAPPQDARAAVCGSTTVTLDTDASVTDFYIIDGGTFAGGSGSNTLSIANSLTNEGTFSSNTETVAFGTATVTGSVTFNNVNLPDAGAASAVDFGADTSINGTLTIGANRSVTTSGISYGSSSTLVYSTGTSYDRGDEWQFSGTGVPYNVRITGGTSLTVPTGRTTQGDLTVDGGSTLVAPSSTLNVGGDWTVDGTFTPNDGTVRFNGSTTQNINSDTTFHNLTLSATGGSVSFGSRTITVTNELSKTGGSMDPGTSTVVLAGSTGSITGSGAKDFYNLAIGSGANVVHNSGGNIDIGGSFTNNGTFTQARDLSTTFDTTGNHTLGGSGTTQWGQLTLQGGVELAANDHDFSVVGDFDITGTFVGGTAVVTFSGSEAQVLDVSDTGSGAFGGLALDNANGLTLTGTASVTETLTLENGRFLLGSNTLTLGPNASVQDGSGGSAFSATNMLVAECSGTLRKQFAAPGSFTYPIGSATGTAVYTPATVTFSSGSFATAAHAETCVSPTKHPDNASNTDYLSRYWTITQSGISGFSAGVSFTYADSDINGTEANLYGGRWDGANWAMLDQADTASNTFGGTRLESFSDFTATDAASLPVTLGYFAAERRGPRVAFTWQTTAETANLGFNLYAATPQGLERLNQSLIPSTAASSPGAADYSFTAVAPPGATFYIEDVNILGQTRRRGPFAAGDTYGARSSAQPIDWAAIAAEHAAKSAARDITLAPQPLTRAAGSSVADLHLARSGLYRVTYTGLLSAGIDLSGTGVTDLALLNRGTAVPIYVSDTDGTFGPGDYFEFYGRALNTLYTQTNIYRLHVDADRARHATTDTSTPTGMPATHYLETIILGEDNLYDVAATGDDPWYDARLVAYGAPAAQHYTISVDHLVAGAAPATLTVDMWGGTSLPDDPDHHVVVDFAGHQVANVKFDGLISHRLEAQLPDGLLQDGNNALQITLPNTLGMPWDVVGIESYGLTYPRAFVAGPDGQLTFLATGTAFEVSGLPSADVVVYRHDVASGDLTRLTQVEVVADGTTYRAKFAGSGSAATYLVYSVDHLLQPQPVTPRPFTDITSGTADYLMLTHANFSADLGPLVDFHTDRGLSVKVVDVADVYDQFNHGIVDPQAIRDYVRHAHDAFGVSYVLLVGGDTYDYFDNFGLGSISFIPSPYQRTGPIINFAPVDPLYADVDDDGVPDLPLGRFPVRTSAELSALINKTVTYANRPAGETAVFAADILAERSFTSMSSDLATGLPDSWAITTAHLDETAVATARQTLLDQLNAGAALTNFVGHSGTMEWTEQGLLTAADVRNLQNAGRPTLVAQWGCWNTFHVRPQYDTLGQEFIKGETGAALVLGATTLTNADRENALGQAFMTYFSRGMAVGAALQQAKAELAGSYANWADVHLGYTILGDPALTLLDCAPPLAPTVSAAFSGSDLDMTWDDVGAARYEVWHSADDVHFTPRGTCEAAANCTVVNATSYTAVNALGRTNSAAYVVRAVSACGAFAETRIAVFRFSLQAGEAP